MQERKENLKQEILNLNKAGTPIVCIGTQENDVVKEVLKDIGETEKREINCWDLANGYHNLTTGELNNFISEDTLESTLNTLSDSYDILENQFIFLEVTNCDLIDEQIVRNIMKISAKIENGIKSTIIISSNYLEIPQKLEEYITNISLNKPNSDERAEIIDEFVDENLLKELYPTYVTSYCDQTSEKEKSLVDLSIQINRNNKPKKEQEEKILIAKLVDVSRGLTENNIKKSLNLDFSKNANLTNESIEIITNLKKKIIMKSSLLEIVEDETSFSDIGGLKALNKYLNSTAQSFKNYKKAQNFNIDLPKGVFITGITGCGKSASAKATANLLELPLIRLNVGRLMSKYNGETEANFRQSIKLLEDISPCVLWIDEFEKCLGNNDTVTSEVTARLNGEILTWLQENKKPIFVVATANNISNIAVEFLRSGRFDEIFYVDLPNKKEREEIFKIAISKYPKIDFKENKDKGIDLTDLAELTKGFSGAEINKIVNEVAKKIVDNENCSKKDIKNYFNNIIDKFKPLSQTNEVEINAMRKFYKEKGFKKASIKNDNKPYRNNEKTCVSSMINKFKNH